MTEHKRRNGYWKYYHAAHTQEMVFLLSNIVSLIVENPCPVKVGSGPGRPIVHSRDKLACLCILMVCLDMTYRDTQCIAHFLRLPRWNDEPVPDHVTLCKFMPKIPNKWLEEMISETARICLAGFDLSALKFAADSTGVVTDRYDKKKKRKDLKPKKVTGKKADSRHESGAKKAERKRKAKPYKQYLKWHVASVLGLQVILACRITSDRMADTTILRSLLQRIGKIGLGFSGIFNADRGYDSDENIRILKESGMKPNIKLRDNAVRTKMKHRKEASEAFDPESYTMRATIEGIFGAEEAENHRLMCRFRKASTRRRFGLCKAIGWNLEVLNRMECAARIGVPVEAA